MSELHHHPIPHAARCYLYIKTAQDRVAGMTVESWVCPVCQSEHDISAWVAERLQAYAESRGWLIE